jgi:hypothetical protein
MYKHHRHGMEDSLTTTIPRADSFPVRCITVKKHNGCGARRRAGDGRGISTKKNRIGMEKKMAKAPRPRVAQNRVLQTPLYLPSPASSADRKRRRGPPVLPPPPAPTAPCPHEVRQERRTDVGDRARPGDEEAQAQITEEN